MKNKQAIQQGFTLLEVLIVLGVLGILSITLITVLNPLETLRKTRDSRRLSDLAAIKNALAMRLTNGTPSTTPMDDGGIDICLRDSFVDAYINYSADPAPGYIAVCNSTIAKGSDAVSTSGFTTGFCGYANDSMNPAIKFRTDGTGWIPVNISSIPGGSPLATLPIDPINTVADRNNPASTDLVYRYVCQGQASESGKPSNAFEINAQLESVAFTTGTENRRTNDGGDNDNYYEVGTSTRLIGTGTNF